MEELQAAAGDLAIGLERSGTRIVFAESCTAGLVASSLAGVPGVSRFLCGSFVVYRNESKAAWLHVSRERLDDPGPVSSEVANAMAEGALVETAEAEIAVSITGHLGPDAPPGLDGVCFIGWQRRDGTSGCERLALTRTGRRERQEEAAIGVLRIAGRLVQE